MASHKRRSRWNIFFYSLVILASLFIGLMMFLPQVSQKIWPYQSYVVISESMEPLIKKNDVIIVKKEASYEIGDVITFSYDLEQDGKIKTRSNRSESLDYWEIEEKDILGKVQYVIPKLGYLFIPVFNHAVSFLLFALILVLIMIVKVI